MRQTLSILSRSTTFSMSSWRTSAKMCCRMKQRVSSPHRFGISSTTSRRTQHWPSSTNWRHTTAASLQTVWVSVRHSPPFRSSSITRTAISRYSYFVRRSYTTTGIPTRVTTRTILWRKTVFVMMCFSTPTSAVSRARAMALTSHC